MIETRKRFHQQLAELEQLVVDMGEQALDQVAEAVDALVTGDMAEADRVIEADNSLDEQYLEAHRRWLAIAAEQQPVAIDLRMMSVVLHVTVTLERMGDQSVNIAKIAKAVAGLPTNEKMLGHIREMGEYVKPIVRTALESFVRRDADLARRLPAMDDPIDNLNRQMYEDVIGCCTDRPHLEWATKMLMVARALERVGDQAVDIGEQVAFLLTGEFQEFSSYPGHGPEHDGTV